MQREMESAVDIARRGVVLRSLLRLKQVCNHPGQLLGDGEYRPADSGKFLRWWNPAVENQATDRAFCIGQHRNVLVHKFMTTGTVEERIDDMIAEKRKLADGRIRTSRQISASVVLSGFHAYSERANGLPRTCLGSTVWVHGFE